MKKRDPSDGKAPSPLEYMKERHPDQVTDSVDASEPLLTRTLLEHVLETLSTERKENEFENFARQLAEREICPNLVPQTGPVGGGDSKSDTITHPTHPAFESRWYESAAPSSGTARWSFAFSCKKKWTDKVRADVAGIASTARKADLIYFVTSQNARDKTKAEIEEELTKAHGIPVHILDRQWILDRVFSRGHEALAIRTFHLEVPSRPTRVLGPRDADRQARLDGLMLKLKSPHDHYRSDFVLAEDFLEAAELARGLARPRHEVEGLALNARRAADRFGLVEQRLRVHYFEAWTAFFWFEDVTVVDSAFNAIAALPDVAR